MSWRNDNNRSFEQPASETPKARISIQSVVTPVVSAILVVIIISFKEWAKSSPWLTGLLFLLFVLLNFYPKIRGRVLNWQKDRSVQREQAAFVKHWQAEFDRLQLLRRLKEFENPTMALSIMKVPAKCNMKAWESNSAMMFEPGGGPLPGGLYELDLSDLNQRTLADLKTPRGEWIFEFDRASASDPASNLFFCKKCGMRFDNLNGLGTHSRQFHKEVIETEPEESEKA